MRISAEKYADMQDLVTGLIIRQNGYFTFQEIENMAEKCLDDKSDIVYIDKILKRTVEVFLQYEIILKRNERYYINRIIGEW